jgi:hypothetical protein
MQTLTILILPIALLVVAVIVGTRKWRPRVPHTPRALWKRVTGAVIAIAALVTVTIGTWRSLQKPPAVGSDTVVRPTLPAPVVKSDHPGGYSTATVEPCQMILRAYLVRNRESSPVIVRANSAVIDWPAEAGDLKKLDMEWRGIDYFLSVEVDEIWDGGGLISLNGTHRLRVETSSGSRGSSSSGGGIAYLGKGTVLTDDPIYPLASHDPLSLWPQISENLAVWLEAELATKDDPLETIPAAKAGLLPSGDRRSMGTTGRVFGSQRQPPGIAMITHWGPASLLLLLTAWAGSYAFHRSGPAFAALLAACILYAGGLERLLIHRMAETAADDQRPIAERRLALERIRDVFFHPEVSKSALKTIAENTSLPEELRARARGIQLPRHDREE